MESRRSEASERLVPYAVPSIALAVGRNIGKRVELRATDEFPGTTAVVPEVQNPTDAEVVGGLFTGWD